MWSKAQKKRKDFVKLLPVDDLGEDWIKKLSKTFSKLELKHADSYLEYEGKTKIQEMYLKIIKKGGSEQK